jgi:hypothetical protein
MSLEQSIQNLADAINNLANSKGANGVSPEAPAADKPKRGRPAKVEVEAPEAPAEDAAAKVAARIAAVSAEAPTPVTPAKAEAPAPAATLTKADVQPVLIEVVKRFGKDACGAICQANGGPNLSSLDPSTYPAVLAAAQEMLSKPAADPTE